MENLYQSAYAVLLNNGTDQILPISKASLIEILNNNTEFGSSTSVQDALSYLLTAYANVDSKIENIEGNLSADGISYSGNTTIYDKIGEVITAYEAANTAQTTALTNALELHMDDSTPGQYVFTQGNTAVGTITLPNDMVATNGTLVNERPRNTSDGEGDGNIAGTYIMMTIANGEAFYIDVKDLVDVYTANNQNDEVTVDITNNNITATIGEISYAKIVVDDNHTTLSSYLNTIQDAVDNIDEKTGADISVGGTGDDATMNIADRLADLQSQITTAAAGGITAVNIAPEDSSYLTKTVDGTAVTIGTNLGNVALLKYDVLNNNATTINEDNFRV